MIAFDIRNYEGDEILTIQKNLQPVVYNGEGEFYALKSSLLQQHFGPVALIRVQYHEMVLVC